MGKFQGKADQEKVRRHAALIGSSDCRWSGRKNTPPGPKWFVPAAPCSSSLWALKSPAPIT